MIRGAPTFGEADPDGGRIIRTIHTTSPLQQGTENTGQIVTENIHGIPRVHSDDDGRPGVGVVEGRGVNEHGISRAVIQPHPVPLAAQHQTLSDFLPRPLDALRLRGFLHQAQSEPIAMR